MTEWLQTIKWMRGFSDCSTLIHICCIGTPTPTRYLLHVALQTAPEILEHGGAAGQHNVLVERTTRVDRARLEGRRKPPMHSGQR